MNSKIFHETNLKTIAIAATLASCTTIIPTNGQQTYCDSTNSTANTNTAYSPAYNLIVDHERFKTSAKSSTNGRRLQGTSNSFAKDNFNSYNEVSPKRNKISHNVYLSGVDLPAYYYNNLALYWSDVEVELFTHADKFAINKEIIRNQAFYTASRVAELNSDNAVFELSSERNLKFSLNFSENRTLMINKPVFGVEGFPSNDIIFSLFIGDELVSADTNDLDDFIDGFKAYLTS